MEPCLEANYTRGFRISVNESHWTLEPGHILMKADDNETLTPLPGIEDTGQDHRTHKKTKNTNEGQLCFVLKHEKITKIPKQNKCFSIYSKENKDKINIKLGHCIYCASDKSLDKRSDFWWHMIVFMLLTSSFFAFQN